MATGPVRLMSSARAFYRSPITPVSFVLSGAYLAFALSPWGPTAWRDTPSLRLLHQVLPWPVLSAGFVAYVVLLLTRSLTAVIIAEAVGLVFYGSGLVALLATLRPDRPANPLAIAGLFLACVLHVLALRLAVIQRETE